MSLRLFTPRSNPSPFARTGNRNRLSLFLAASALSTFTGGVAFAVDGDANDILLKKMEKMEQRIQSLEAELKQKQVAKLDDPAKPARTSAAPANAKDTNKDANKDADKGGNKDASKDGNKDGNKDSAKNNEMDDNKDSDKDNVKNDEMDDKIVKAFLGHSDGIEPVKTLCYEDVNLLLLPNPNGPRDLLALEIDLRYTKGHQRQTKRSAIYSSFFATVC